MRLARSTKRGDGAVKEFISLGTFMAVFSGWLTHLYICFTVGAWGFLIAGAIFFPIGVVHGWGLWLGIW